MNEDIHDQINDIVNNADGAHESLESAFVAGRLAAAFYAGLREDMEWADDDAIYVVAQFATNAFERMIDAHIEEEGGD